VEGYGSTIDSGDNNNQGFDSDIGNAAGFLSNGLMDMSEFPFYGKANGGVIPVSVEYASKLLDYSGKEVAPYVMGYPWKEPTESGYTIMANMDKVSNTFYVYNRKGKMMFNWTGSYGTIGIGEANVFWLKQDNGNSYRITYYLDDGSVLFDTGEYTSDNGYYDKATAFHDGKAYMSICGENTVDLYQMDFKGVRTRVQTLEEVIADDHIDGYMAMYNPEEYHYRLYNVKANEYSEALQEVAANILYEEEDSGGEDAVITQYYHKYFEAGTTEYYHYKQFGVLEASYGSIYKDVLFDYFDVKDGRLSKAVAIYDEIIFNNYDYLLVREDDEYFYIDLNGEKVSKTYQAATSFNDNGLAMILEDGVASMIDDHFNVVTVVEDLIVKKVENNGDVFKLQDVNNVEYLFYYEVK
jgi:hypothetical protein